MTRFEFDGFLKDRGIYDHAYSVEDLGRDLETLGRLEAFSTRAVTAPPGL